MGNLPFIDDGDRLEATVRCSPRPGMIGGLEMCRASPVQQQEGAQGAAMGLIREQRANRESVADPVLSRGAVNTDDSFMMLSWVIVTGCVVARIVSLERCVR